VQLQFSVQLCDALCKYLRTPLADAALTSGLVPFQGVNLFRMARDDVFLRLSLRRISHLWRDHVLRGHPPPIDAWYSDPDYQVSTAAPNVPVETRLQSRYTKFRLHVVPVGRCQQTGTAGCRNARSLICLELVLMLGMRVPCCHGWFLLRDPRHVHNLKAGMS